MSEAAMTAHEWLELKLLQAAMTAHEWLAREERRALELPRLLARAQVRGGQWDAARARCMCIKGEPGRCPLPGSAGLGCPRWPVCPIRAAVSPGWQAVMDLFNESRVGRIDIEPLAPWARRALAEIHAAVEAEPGRLADLATGRPSFSGRRAHGA